jgi:hypothetical protein
MKTRNKAKQQSFLAAFAETASYTKAAEAAKIGHETHYRLLKDDAEYAVAFEEFKRKAVQVLEDEVIRRALEGVLVPVFHKGEPTGVIRRYSDSLLMFLLKGFMPEKYRERTNVEAAGLESKPIVLADARFDQFSDEELSQFVLLTKKRKPKV